MGGLRGFLKGNADKVRDKYLSIWAKIIQEYGLGLEQSQYRYIAEALGKAEGKKGLFGIVKGIFSGGVLSILGAIVTFGSAFFTFGGSLGFLSYLGFAIGAVSMGYSYYASEKAIKLAIELGALQSAGAMGKAREEAYSQGDQLTQFIVYTDYEIYANNSLYQKQDAGSQTYSPSIAFDTAKGIYGQMRNDEVDEQIQSRAHFTKAGNKGYIAETLQVGFPLVEGGLPIKDIQDSLENNARENNKRIANGFMKLAEQKFNYLGTLESFYKKVLEAQVYPFYKKMVTWDFLDKNKNYQKALRANFDYLKMSDLTGENKTQSEAQKQKATENAFTQNPRFQRALKEKANACLSSKKTDMNAFKTWVEAYSESSFPNKSSATSKDDVNKGWIFGSLKQVQKCTFEEFLAGYKIAVFKRIFYDNTNYGSGG